MPFIVQKDGHRYDFYKVRSVGRNGELMILEAQLEEKKRFNDIMIFIATIKETDIPELKEAMGSGTKPTESLEKRFERETGKNAMWRGKITKGFIKWEMEEINNGTS